MLNASIFRDAGHRQHPTPRFGSPRRHPELERLICAAAIDPRFAALLVAEPAYALAQSGIGSRLSADEHAMVTSITGARDIHDFAGQLYLLAYTPEH